MITADLEQELIKTIQKKKELAVIDYSLVKKTLNQVLKEIPPSKLLNLHFRSSVFKTIIKLSRHRLRRVGGLFESEYPKEEFAKFYSSSLTPKSAHQILKYHPSTKERLDCYPQFYKEIFKRTKNLRQIVDIGSGLHPLSLPYFKKKDITYTAYDINTKSVELVTEFFLAYHKKYTSFNGLSKVKDAEEITEIKADLVLLLKLTDILDKNKGHIGTEKLLNKINARYILISFSTITMSGEKMRAPERRWLYYLAKRLGYKIESFTLGSELFYLLLNPSIIN